MRAVIQKVSKSRVTVEGKTKGEIGKGLLVLLGVKKGDTEEQAVKMGKKLILTILATTKNRHMSSPKISPSYIIIDRGKIQWIQCVLPMVRYI